VRLKSRFALYPDSGGSAELSAGPCASMLTQAGLEKAGVSDLDL